MLGEELRICFIVNGDEKQNTLYWDGIILLDPENTLHRLYGAKRAGDSTLCDPMALLAP